MLAKFEASSKAALAMGSDLTAFSFREARDMAHQRVLDIEAEAAAEVRADLIERLEGRRPAYDPSEAGQYEHGIEDAYRAVLALLQDDKEAGG